MVFSVVPAYSQYCDVGDSQIAGLSMPISPCGSEIDFSEYIPYDNSVPTKTMNLIFHIVQDGDFANNFTENDKPLLESYMAKLNAGFSQVQPLETIDEETSCSDQTISNSKIQFKLAAIKFHQNDNYNCTTTNTFCCSFDLDPGRDVFDFYVTENGNLSDEEKNSYFPVIFVGKGGPLDCNDECIDDIDSEKSASARSDFVIIKGIHDYQNTDFGFVNILAHELGHVLGLAHSFQGVSGTACGLSVFDCCFLGERHETNNIMDGDFEGPYLDDPFSIIDCQLGIMHYFLENTHSQYLENSLCEKQEEDIVISEDKSVLWSGNKYVSQDVHIYGNLTVTCDVYIANDVDIIVHRGGNLFISGGHLMACDTEWNGIVVEGISSMANNNANGAGRLIINERDGERAIIENASLAISMDARHLNHDSDFFGGYVRAENSTITNCRRAAAFMRHAQDGVEDQSFFNRMNFSNIRDSGVTIWANDGVEFDRCSFSNVGNGNNVFGNKHEGIRAEQAWINVNLNKFNLLPHGIVLEGFDMFSNIHRPSTITNCDFNAEDIGIEILTYNPSQDNNPNGQEREWNLIQNNEFLSGASGVYVDRPSPLRILDNDFVTDDHGVWLETGNAANYVNQVDRNSFDGIEQACIFDGFNSELQFLSNCFSGPPSTAFPDVNVAGSISIQGSEVREAGNKFTKGGKMEIASSVGFNYHVLNTRQPGEPEYLDISSGAVQAGANTANTDVCGAMFSPGPDPEYCATHLANVSKVDLYKQLSSKVRSKVSGQSSSEMSEVELKTMLRGEQAFELRSFVPSFSIRNGDYQLAKTELSSIQTESPEQNNYIEAQNIYVDFLMSGRQNVSSSQLEFLRNAGTESGRLNAYARTILHIVSGERIERIAPPVQVELGNREKQMVSRSISCYPNPVQQSTYYLSISEKETADYTYYLSDVKGNQTVEGSFQSNVTKAIDCRGISPGIYLIVIRDKDQNDVYNDKLVVIE